MLKSRTFLTTTLGLLGAILGFVLFITLLTTGALQGRVEWFFDASTYLLGDLYGALVVFLGMFLVPTLGMMFVGFSLAKRLAASHQAQLPNKPHPLD